MLPVLVWPPWEVSSNLQAPCGRLGSIQRSFRAGDEVSLQLCYLQSPVRRGSDPGLAAHLCWGISGCLKVVTKRNVFMQRTLGMLKKEGVITSST